MVSKGHLCEVGVDTLLPVCQATTNRASDTCDAGRCSGCNPPYGDVVGLPGASFQMVAPWAPPSSLGQPSDLPDRGPDDVINTISIMLYQAPGAPGSATDVVNVAIGMHYNSSLLNAATEPSYHDNPVWGTQGKEVVSLIPSVTAGTLCFLKMLGEKSDVGTKTEATSNGNTRLKGNTREDLANCLLAHTSDYGGEWPTVLHMDGLLICDRPGVGLTVMSEFDRIFLATMDGSTAPPEHASGYPNFSVFLETAKLLPRQLHRLSLEPMAYCFLVVQWLWSRTTSNSTGGHGLPTLEVSKLYLTHKGTSLLAYIDTVLKDRKLYNPGKVTVGSKVYDLSAGQLSQIKEEARMLEYYLPYTFGSVLEATIAGEEEGEYILHPTWALPNNLRAGEWRMNDPTLCVPPQVSHHSPGRASPAHHLSHYLCQVGGTPQPTASASDQRAAAGVTPAMGNLGIETPQSQLQLQSLQIEQLKAQLVTMQEAVHASMTQQSGPAPTDVKTAMLTVTENDLPALMAGTKWMEGFVALAAAYNALNRARYGPNICGCGSFAPPTVGIPVVNGAPQVHAPGMFQSMPPAHKEQLWGSGNRDYAVSQISYRTDKIHYCCVISDYQTAEEKLSSGGEPVHRVSLKCPQVLPCVECSKLLFSSAKWDNKLLLGDYNGDEEVQADHQVRRFFSEEAMGNLVAQFGLEKAQAAKDFVYHARDMCPMLPKHWLLPSSGCSSCPIDPEVWATIKQMNPVENTPVFPRCLPGARSRLLRQCQRLKRKPRLK